MSYYQAELEAPTPVRAKALKLKSEEYLQVTRRLFRTGRFSKQMRDEADMGGILGFSWLQHSGVHVPMT
jgi:hypothetical protein